MVAAGNVVEMRCFWFMRFRGIVITLITEGARWSDRQKPSKTTKANSTEHSRATDHFLLLILTNSNAHQ